MNLGTFILTPVLLAATAALGQVQPDASAPQRTGAPHAVSATTLNKLTTERFPGKQDDIFFINVRVGWYCNGASKVFRTTDGGDTWTAIWEPMNARKSTASSLMNGVRQA